MGKRGRPPKRSAAGGAADAAPKGPPEKRARPVRTPQTPFEAAAAEDIEEGLHEVDHIKNVRFVKGVRQYEVVWQGYDEKDTTWEPMENLVGCAQQIREYEKGRAAEDEAAKEEVLRKKQERREQQAKDQAELRERAAAAALKDAEGDNVVTVDDGDAADTNPVLKKHRGKSGIIWTCFDLSKELPSCVCKTAKGTICQEVPSATAGTTNYWSHLFTKHRQTWLELKQTEGKLNPSGVKELEKLVEEMNKGGTTYAHNKGGEFLSAKLPPSVKDTMDRITSEWIVDTDQAFNAASSDGFRRMMERATNGKYDGCSDETVKHHITIMAEEGKAEVKEYHQQLRKVGIKPTASGDLWSKNRTALFGLVSHGIRRKKVPGPNGGLQAKWEMVEKLCGSVPCKGQRHTGQHIGELSDAAWAGSGLSNPVEDIFVRVSDNGSNMIKGWENGLQTPCVDHTLELSVKMYHDHPPIEATLCKGRGIVGYFNSSVIGTNDEQVGLGACQQTAGVPTNALTQDVKTRWRSTHDMCNSLRINQEALLLYEVRNPGAAKGFTDNRLSLEDWEINNQTVAVLAPLSNASKYLEAKVYPTSNLVLPSILGCIHLLKSDAPVKQPWGPGVFMPSDLRPEVAGARKKLLEDMEDRWVHSIPEWRKRFYYISTICDPRQKALRFPGVSAQERETALDWFEAEYLSFYGDKDPACAPAAAAAATAATAKSSTSAAARASHAQHAGSSFLDFMADLNCVAALVRDKDQQHANVQEDDEEEATVLENEARKYLSLPDAPMSTDVLQWWADHEDTFPNLSVLAQQYLGAPATSASAERLFSVAGRVFGDLRQHMNDKELEAVMWARVNSETRKAAN